MSEKRGEEPTQYLLAYQIRKTQFGSLLTHFIEILAYFSRFNMILILLCFVCMGEWEKWP